MEIDKRAVLVTVSLSSFLTPFSGSSFNIALPSIAAEYALDAISMSWASLAYLLASAMFLIPFGRLADMYGRKRVFLYGIIVFTASSALLGIYPSSSTLVLFRALQGIGSSMIFGTSLAILVSVSTPQERGTMLGTSIAAVYIGLSAGPYIGGFLTKNFGWRSIFLANVVIGLMVLVLILTKLKAEWRINNGEKFDIIGSAAFSFMLLALMYGMSKLPTRAAFLPIAIGVALMAVFAIIEGRVDNPVLDLSIFRSNGAYTMFNIAALINFSATFSLTFLLSMYLQYLKGLDPQQAGTIMIAAPIIQAIVSPIAGRLSDSVQPAKIATIGMGVTGLALAPLAFLTANTSIVYIILCLLVLGAGLALFSSPNTNAIMGCVDKSLLGVASSTVGTMRLTGQMLSQGIAMTLIAINLGTASIVPDLYPQLLTSISSTFTVFFLLCILGAGASYWGSRMSSYN
ncbi:MFS transporter [Candidatus Bathyarchaeota archaeon]|nr:MAG: MFS transporter [Candidatus Bathyarchaeota archaeon]